MRLAAIALVLRIGAVGEPELLMIKRSEHDGDPWSGHVACPGGRMEAGDHDLTQTAMRETWEETGLKVDLTGLVGVYTYPGAPVIIVYRARVISGTLTVCSENDLLEWRTPAEIPWDQLAFPSTRDALREWVGARGEMPGG